VGGQVSSLVEAIESGDTESIRARAHQLKGASASVGAEAMRYCAADIEKKAAGGQLAEKDKPGVLNDLEQQLNFIAAWAEEKGGLM